MTHSEDIKELLVALVKAQEDIKNPEKNANNPFKKYKYADLGEVLDCVRIPLSKNGLVVMQPIGTKEENILYVETFLYHTSGQWLQPDTLAMKMSKADPQELGMISTYLKRYALTSLLGIAGKDEDSDGEKEKEPTNGKQQKETKPQTRKEEPKKNTPPTQAPPAAPPAKTEEKKKEDKIDTNKEERIKTLWNRTKIFHSPDEFKEIVKEKWNVEGTSQLADKQLTEWASYVRGLEIRKLNEQRDKEQKEKEPAAEHINPPEPLSARSEVENSKLPWSVARPDQVTKIEELLNEINWDRERQIQWWETYRRSHKIETSAMVDLTNTQASSLIVYLENKLREVRLDASTSPPPSIDPAEEEARKINEENQKLALEDKVPF